MPAPFLPFGTLFYQLDGSGWSETWALVGIDYAAAAANLDMINTARLSFAPTKVQVIEGRISDSSVRGDSKLVNLTTAEGQWGTPLTDGPLPPDNTILFRFEAGALKRAMRQFHGVPTSQFSLGVYVPSGPYLTTLASFASTVVPLANIATKIKPTPLAPPFYTFSPYTVGFQRGIANKRVGRPFDLPRGRRLTA